MNRCSVVRSGVLRDRDVTAVWADECKHRHSVLRGAGTWRVCHGRAWGGVCGSAPTRIQGAAGAFVAASVRWANPVRSDITT